MTEAHPPGDELPIAVRAWTSRVPALKSEETSLKSEETKDTSKRASKGRSKPQREYPQEALVFDTETAPGLDYKLWFIVWRVYRDRPGAPRGHYCVEEGIAYADDLPTSDPAGFKVICNYAETAEAAIAPGLGRPGEGRKLVLKPASWWLQERLFRLGYGHRDRCQVVGFNLPFDLAGLAHHWGDGKGYYRGGWSLSFWGKERVNGQWQDLRYHPRLRYKAIDPRRTIFGWGSLKEKDGDGKGGSGMFVDLRTVTFALTNGSYSLEGACAAFGDPFKKSKVSYESISPELISYALEDIEHTSILYRKTAAELEQHEGIDLQAHRLFSPASVGVRYLEEMRVKRPLDKFTDLSSEQLGWDWYRMPKRRRPQIGEDLLGRSMSAFYGGRAEARLVRVVVPVVHVDFTSMYPAVNELLKTWRLIRAAKITVVDATDDVIELLSGPNLLERFLERETWERVGVTLVEIEPDGDILPTRAAYEPDGPGHGIGLNPLYYDGRMWFALPDVIAAAILNPGKLPRVVKALRLEPLGIQKGLRSVKLRGGRELDPRADRDPFLTMVEERQRIRQDSSLSEEERERRQLFLKITANGTSYGSLARLDRRDQAKESKLSVSGPGEDAREWSTKTPEDPGPLCFPPVAASITAGARLMLALLERQVTDAGGTYAMADTDALAIVAAEAERKFTCPTPDGSDHALVLSTATVQEILDRFQRLNPYDPELLAPWKIEHDSISQPLYCYALSAKRYCLFRFDDRGEIFLVYWSEHGLGSYVDPSGREDDDARDEEGRRIWMREVWEWVLGNALGKATSMPIWADRPALSSFTVSSPRLADWFGSAEGAQVRPGSFGLLAHPDEAFYGSPAGEGLTREGVPLPAAPLEKDPEKWSTIAWRDRRTGKPIRTVTADQLRVDPEAFATVASGDVTVIETLSRVLGRFIRRPEHKSNAPDGQAVGPNTSGLLARRPVRGRPALTELIGKEGNMLIERLEGQPVESGMYRNEYGPVGDPWEEVLEDLQAIGATEIVERTGFSRSAVYEVLRGARPHPKNAGAYEAAARGA